MVVIVSYNLYSQHLNYGAAIHNFAFQTYLKRKGVSSVVLDYYPLNLLGCHFKFPVLYAFSRPFSKRRMLKNLIQWGPDIFQNLIKFNKFNRFFQTYYFKSKVKIRPGEEKKLRCVDGKVPSAWCVVADVIWKLENVFDPVFFLDFPLAEKGRKVAYAPSMGSHPLHELKNGTEALALIKKFDAVSSRESEGAEYLSERLGREVKWLIDPSLLLDGKDYETLLHLPAKVKESDKYLLIYNCMVNDVEMCKEAENYAKRFGLKVIEISIWGINGRPLLQEILRRFGMFERQKVYHKVITEAGIEEWLTLIKNAEVVFTNSFHGSCFSMLFKRKFLCFQRDETDYKMKNLMREFGLLKWFIPWNNKKVGDIDDIDYDAVYAKLAVFRKKAEDFINENLVVNSVN